MKKITMKIIAVVTTIVILVAFGVNAITATDTYKKYKLAAIAYSQGATDITIQDNEVAFRNNGKHVTYYSFDYGIKELSGK